TGTVMSRPSNSGKATFMAVSSGLSPRLEASHCQRIVPAQIACKTGTFKAAKALADQPHGVGPSGLISPRAKETVETKTSMRRPPCWQNQPNAAGQAFAENPSGGGAVSLSVAVNTGSALAP